jgi:hypothetical protein
MDWKTIFQSLFSRALWEMILIAGGGAMFGLLKAKWPNYAPRVLYGVSGAACVAVLLFTLTGRAILSSPIPAQSTPDNIEANVKLWSENLGLPFAKSSMPDSYFAYSITTRGGTPITVGRPTKEKTGYLQFVSTISFSPEHQAVLGTLTKEQVDTVMQELSQELARTRVASTIAVMTMPQTGANVVGQTMLVLQRAESIANLDEAQFADRVDDMEFAVSLVRSTTSLALRRATAARGKNAPIIHTN